jgi:hypothetical protein
VLEGPDWQLGNIAGGLGERATSLHGTVVLVLTKEARRVRFVPQRTANSAPCVYVDIYIYKSLRTPTYVLDYTLTASLVSVKADGGRAEE